MSVDDTPPFNSVTVHRGDIVIVALNPTKGSEQRGTRPAVVVQNDVGNFNAPTTIIAPCTTRYEPGNLYPFEVEIKSDNTPLREDSVVDCSQLRTVDMAERITENIGSVPPTTMNEIDHALRVSLGFIEATMEDS